MKSIRILFAVLSCINAPVTLAQANALQANLKPYIEVQPVASDDSIVRVYYSPSCEYSRHYATFFKNLSGTLPRSQKYEITPLVNKRDGATYALSFLAVKRFYPAYVQNFVDASLIATHELGLSPKSWPAMDRIAKAAHLPVPVTQLVNANLTLLKHDLDELITLQSALKVTNTPSVAVGGQYIVTPEFTSGNPEQFSTLVNAVISMNVH